MSDAQLWPKTPLIDCYLQAAAIHHTGHRVVDLAVLYAIMQNYINRSDIVIARVPFRVHFFLIGYSGFGKSRSLNFGFNEFLPAHFRALKQPPDERFMDVGGQNTAAGLSDAFNAVSDRYGRQILTTWIEETVTLFPPKGIGRFQSDIASLFDNILLGKANVRHVREKTTSVARDRVDKPIINACFPATPQQYAELMKSSSSDMLRRFMLVSPNEQDRNAYDQEKGQEHFFDPEPALFDASLETFSQWLNMLETHQGMPEAPTHVTRTEGAYRFLKDRFETQNSAAAAEEKRTFFLKKKRHILMIAGLNALARFSLEINEEDAACAWNLGVQSWRHLKRLDQDEEDLTPLTPTQRNRADLIKRVCRVVERSHKKGLGRREICRSIRALNMGYSQLERDDLFAYIEQEAEDVGVFFLNVEAERKNGRSVNKKLYFSVKTWSQEQAAENLLVAKPVWSASASSFQDAAGGMHAELRDCIGYKPEWEAEVSKGGSSFN